MRVTRLAKGLAIVVFVGECTNATSLLGKEIVELTNKARNIRWTTGQHLHELSKDHLINIYLKMRDKMQVCAELNTTAGYEGIYYKDWMMYISILIQHRNIDALSVEMYSVHEKRTKHYYNAEEAKRKRNFGIEADERKKEAEADENFYVISDKLQNCADTLAKFVSDTLNDEVICEWYNLQELKDAKSFLNW